MEGASFLWQGFWEERGGRRDFRPSAFAPLKRSVGGGNTEVFQVVVKKVKEDMLFMDRADAGRQLAAVLLEYAGENPVVLGLPRGGVPVAAEVARSLSAPLDVIVVRKIGAPAQPELGLGAVAEGGVEVWNRSLLEQLQLAPSDVLPTLEREKDVVVRRVAEYREGRAIVDLSGRCVLVIDDGLATGGTASAAAVVVQALGAAHVVLAIPVAPRETVQNLAAPNGPYDEVVCLHTPTDFRAIGYWYGDFKQVDSSTVRFLLAQSREEVFSSASERTSGEARVTGEGKSGQDVSYEYAPEDRGGEASREADLIAARTERGGSGEASMHAEPRFLRIPLPQAGAGAGEMSLYGDLFLPPVSAGVVLFAHGSGSSRHSPRNRAVARVLCDEGITSLLFDLLTPAEEDRHDLVFDIPFLAQRLADATDWVRTQPGLEALPIGYFGASTGAGAALTAAAGRCDISAVVSRGGRPDLSIGLSAVRAPTLLIVGEFDRSVLRLNQVARRQLTGCVTDLAVIPRATHLFQETGALEEVAALASVWFRRFFAAETTARDVRPGQSPSV